MVKRLSIEQQDDWVTVFDDDDNIIFENHSMSTMDVVRLLRKLGYEVTYDSV